MTTLDPTRLDEGASPRPLIISPDTERAGGDVVARTPPGQVLTKKWPVLHFGEVPEIDRADWSLRVWGECDNPFTLNFDDLRQLPCVDVHCDIHCVTRWSRLDNVFTGIPTRVLIDLAKPRPNARYVIQHATSDPDGDWTTNVAIDEFTADDALITWQHDGAALTPDHGGPVRAVVPRLYFWKGAKWISGIEIVDRDRPGFWELNGYHMHGDPWREERFGW